MSSRRAANAILRGISRLRGIAVSGRRADAVRSKAVPKKMKHSVEFVEWRRAPAVQTASWFGSVSWSGVMLFAYIIVWFAIVSSFIF